MAKWITLYSFLLFLHLIGAAFWLGGLMTLAIFVVAGLRRLERPAFRTLIRQAGWWFAYGSVAAWLVLIVTGLLMARTHLSGLSDLRTTHFGQMLLDKTGWVVTAAVAAVGHVLAGRSASPRLVQLSRALAVVAFLATLAVFYYATLLA